MSRFIGKRFLQGLTNQNLASLVEFSLTLYQSDLTAINLSAVALPGEFGLRHRCDSRIIKAPSGDRCAVFITDEHLELSVTATPAGTGLTNALKAGTIPEALGWGTVAGAPDIGCGPYKAGVTANNGVGAYNGDNWLYIVDGEIRPSVDDLWTVSLTLIRSPGLARAAAITT